MSRARRSPALRVQELQTAPDISNAHFAFRGVRTPAQRHHDRLNVIGDHPLGLGDIAFNLLDHLRGLEVGTTDQS